MAVALGFGPDQTRSKKDKKKPDLLRAKKKNHFACKKSKKNKPLRPRKAEAWRLRRGTLSACGSDQRSGKRQKKKKKKKKGLPAYAEKKPFRVKIKGDKKINCTDQENRTIGG